MNDMKILQMEVNLNSEKYNMDLSEDMIINVSDINESYIDQPARYSWWAVLATLARSKANKLKQQIDKEQDYLKTTLTGTLDGKVRQEMELNGEKVTETKVTNAIYSNPEYIAVKQKICELQDSFLEADEQARMLEVGKETMNQRKEMLISLGAQLRNDYDGGSNFAIKSEKIADVKSIVGKRRKTERTPIITESEED